jgi:hypothetical protein
MIVLPTNENKKLHKSLTFETIRRALEALRDLGF